MKLWLSRNTEVPLQEQLSAQLVMGMVSGDLAPGERLPSSSQLALRFRVHPNTVRLAYRELVRTGWVEWRRGSGFYVRDRTAQAQPEGTQELDRLMADFLEAARRRGHSAREIRERVFRWLSLKPPDHVLVIEPDAELREILVAELQDSVSVPVRGVGLPAFSKRKRLAGVVCCALYDRPQVRALVPPQVPCVLLRSNSIPKALAREQRPPVDTLITVVSECRGFLNQARATLVAVGIDAAAVELRRGQIGDIRNLAAGTLIIADSLKGRGLPPHPGLRVFRIIADDSIEKLREWFRPGGPFSGS